MLWKAELSVSLIISHQACKRTDRLTRFKLLTLYTIVTVSYSYSVLFSVHFNCQGAVDVLRQTYLENGLLGLFRGNSATMARIIPYASLQFTAHEQFKQLLRKDDKKG